jgi:hypothetical protein
LGQQNQGYSNLILVHAGMPINHPQFLISHQHQQLHFLHHHLICILPRLHPLPHPQPHPHPNIHSHQLKLKQINDQLQSNKFIPVITIYVLKLHLMQEAKTVCKNVAVKSIK